MVRNLLLFFSFMIIATAAIGQTSIEGKVTDSKSGDPVSFANVAIYKGGNLVTGVQTDLDGNYSFTNIDPATYDLEVSFLGYATSKITGIRVLAGASTKLNVEMQEEGLVLEEVVVKAYKVPLMKADETTQGKTLTSEEIRNLPTRSINGIASNAAGAASTDEGDAIAIRGSRTSSTVYMVDGVRVTGSMIPESEIEQMQVITGGIEAKYGDVTGGVISITTKGPSKKFSGGVEAESSKFLDPFDNNLVGFNLSGPILKNKDKTNSILGFRLSGRYSYRKDDDPNAIPVYRIKDSKLAEIEANPVIEIGGDPLVAADFLTNDDVNAMDYQPYESNTRYSAVGKIDARLSDAVDMTLSGSYITSKNQFTPNENSRTRANWRLLNAHNNPFENKTDYRVNFRFRHRLGGGVDNAAAEEEKGSASVIQNVSYSLQGGIEKNLSDLTDPRHGFNYFDYGYIGKVDYEWVPSIAISIDTTGTFQYQNVDYRQVLRGYHRGDANPVLANYNNYLEIPEDDQLNGSIGSYVFSGQNSGDLFNLTDFVAYNGTVSTVFRNSWDFHTNVGTVYNLARKRDDDIYTFNASANFDIVPGSSDKGRHSIELGVTYEQRTNRGYSVYPQSLWTVARQKANEHIQGIPFDDDGNPTTSEVGSVVVQDIGTGLDVEVPIYGLSISENADNTFYKKVRAANGVDLDQFINIDGLDPSQMSLDMFSAKELNDEGLLSYFGYDYLGNKFDGTFNDFFTAKDADGIRTFPVAPNRPIYTSAYIQDKFKYKDIIFRVGVRLDRYDANTKVLKDKYSLYEIMGADEFHSTTGIGTKPGNIGADYKVYLEGKEASSPVKAYRNGDQWYRANGAPVNSPSEIFSAGLVNPKYKDPRAAEDANFIKSRDYDPNVSFKDYEVQVNVMPRLAFSFPIGVDEEGEATANFFAHYDILVERPSSNTIATARDYFYFIDEASQLKNNPDLKPSRTVDYEVGFQQKLNESSAIKISAYYKELRDMIQRRTIFPVPDITSYDTYDNLDFGTIKGFSFAYDLRRTRNLMINANYTLQFADGTGSDANSSGGISSRGVIRNLSPLSLDERHRFVLALDYRFPSKGYTGPELFGVPIFANMGFNLQAIGVSGRPYTANITPLVLDGSQIKGAINGARKPFNYTLNFRVDKTVNIGKNNSFNVYLRISNLLDTKNVISVYPATGSPEDDGFLSSPRGADAIEAVRQSKLPVEAYLASYQWRRANPNFYSLPRRIFLGASFNF